MADADKSPVASPGQLPLPFPARKLFGRDTFQASGSNGQALELIDRWPRWPSTAAALYAPPGSGKTHAMHLWVARSQATILDGASLTDGDVFALPERFSAAVDDADKAAITGDGARALFHLLNRAAQEGGFVLVTGASHPAQWPTPLPDLRTRLGALTAVAIEPPDDALMAAVLTKAFSDRQLKATPALISFVVARIERNFAAAERLVSAMDQATLGTGKMLSFELADRLIAAQTHD
jgi:chromosomal replication initiation ATPase DnaA